MTDADAATLVGAGVVSVMLFRRSPPPSAVARMPKAQPADADDVAPPSLRPKPDRRSGMANEAYIYEAIRTRGRGKANGSLHGSSP